MSTGPADLYIAVLGPIEASREGSAVNLGRPRQRLVLAVLASYANRVVSTDRLIDELWGENPPARALHSVHTYVSNLRSVLGTGTVDGGLIVTRRPGYLLSAEPDQLDATQFEGLAAEGREALTDQPSRARAVLRKALKLWRGRPYEGLSDDAPSLLADAARLEEMRLAAAEDLMEADLALGQHRAVVSGLEALLREHPLRERIAGMLMSALYRSGRQAEALRVYQRIRRQLGEELGIEPSPELQRLEERILQQDAVLDTAAVRHVEEPEARYPAIADRSVTGKGPRERVDGRDVEDVYGTMEARRPAFLSDGNVASEPVREVFVGRHEELGGLDEHLSRSLAGEGRLVFITGEAGTGKTALAKEFVERAQAAHPELIVASGTCEALTGMGDPYLPFRAAMSMLTADCERPWAAGVITRDHALRLWRLLPQAARAICEVGPTLLNTFVAARSLAERVRALNGDDERPRELLERLLADETAQGALHPEQHRTHAEYAAVLEALAACQPLVVVIDDLHWADTSSIHLLAYLSRRLLGRRIFMLGTYRPEHVAQGRGGEPHPLAQLISDLKHRLGARRVDLDRLEAAHGRQFVDDLVDAEPNALPKGFREQLAERSGGRALFAAELLRHVQLQGYLRRDADGRWVEAGEILWQTMPSRVEGVIEQMFTRLDAQLRDALLAASVEGVEFTAEVVASVQGIEPTALVRRLSDEAAQQHRLIEARGAHRTGHQLLSRYRFRHSLFQHYLYEALDPVLRAHLHEAVGSALEELHQPQLADVAVQLASHYQEAGLNSKASRYLQQAGDRSLRLSASIEAVRFYREALQIVRDQRETPDRARDELSVLVKLSRPLAMTQGYWAEEIERGLTRARALAEELGASQELFAALRGLWHYHHSRLQLDEARDLADRSLALASSEGQPVLAAQAHWMLGENAFISGKLAMARDHLKRAIAEHDPTQYRSHPSPAVLDPGVISRIHAATTLWVLGYPDRASKEMAEALALARQEPRSLSFGVALGITGSLHEFRREAGLALDIADEMIRMASDLEYEPLLAAGRFNRGAALAEMGVLEDGISLMKQGIKTYRGAFLPRALAAMAAAQWKAGHAAEGLAAVTEALALTDQAGGYFLEAELWRLKGELALLAGRDQREAMDDFETSIDTARSQGAKSYELRAVLSIARLLQRQGRTRDAFEMLSEAYDWFTEGFETGDLSEAKNFIDQLRVAP